MFFSRYASLSAAKRAISAPLLPKRAHDAHAGEILLRERRQIAEVRLHRLEARVNVAGRAACPTIGSAAIGSAAMSVSRGEMTSMKPSANAPPAIVLPEVHDRRARRPCERRSDRSSAAP